MSRAKHWVFTINNPTETDDEAQDRFKQWPNLKYFVFQREKETTEHFQGYVIFSTQTRFQELKELDARAHWEVKRGTAQQARAYCTKTNTRVSGPYEFGENPTGQGHRTDIMSAIDTLRDGGIRAVREEHPSVYLRYSRGFRDFLLHDIEQRTSERQVTLLYGPPGTGKTRYFMENEPNGISLPCDQGFWFDGYEGQSSVLLDDFAGRASRWVLNSILRVLDRYNVLVPIKGSFVPWTPDKVYISSNIHPRDWYNYATRGDQYVALVRRITRLIIYTDRGSTVVDRPDGYATADKHSPGEWYRFFHPSDPVTVNSPDIPRQVGYLNQYDFGFD